MPKFDDYTQKTTPEDTDIALILDKTANVNKKTPFSGIWTWIVNKMTNAVIQNLQTTNKTVIGSINELNSKTIMDKNYTVDCNTVTDLFKFCNDDSNNLPERAYGVLFTIIRDSFVSVQIFFNTSSQHVNVFVRTKNMGNWNEWSRVQFVIS